MTSSLWLWYLDEIVVIGEVDQEDEVLDGATSARAKGRPHRPGSDALEMV
jgi:hypothetical protein